MRRIILRSVAALTLAATVTVPQQATAQELPPLPQPPIPQPTIPTVQDMRKEVDRIEYEAYKALPKELQDLSLIHISEPTRHTNASRMPSSA